MTRSSMESPRLTASLRQAFTAAKLFLLKVTLLLRLPSTFVSITIQGFNYKFNIFIELCEHQFANTDILIPEQIIFFNEHFMRKKEIRYVLDVTFFPTRLFVLI